MGRSEPCVLFAQTFVHPQLDEYVDEVVFAEPVIITACEFLEQNASSASQAVSLVGATLPPSFALEVFVQCEGEPKFKRLCHPFLYSPSAPYPLEVEAVVTNHLVVRGSYRSLSLVIYGNIVKDLGQYNIILEGRSVTDLVSSAEGNLEDLPLVLHSINRTIEECISSLNILPLHVAASDISVQIKQLLQLMLKILELSSVGDVVHKVVNTVVSAASSYVTHDLGCDAIYQKNLTFDSGELHCVIIEARKELLELYEVLQHQSGNLSSESLEECNFLESEADLATSKQLVDMLSPYFHFRRNWSGFGHHQLSEDKNVILGLSVALLLCSSRESCFHFVNGGGINQLAHFFSHDVQRSTSITLLLLGVIEQATRHSVGCEGFLGWWPREDENIPSDMSEGYSHLLKLLMQKPRHDVASLATYVLHRLRFYEVAARYECAVLSVLGSLSHVGRAVSTTSNMLIKAKSQLKKLLKLINSRGTIEDPTPGAYASRSLILGQTEGLLSYKATSNLIASSNCSFSNSDIDSHLLALLKVRGFLPLSAALLSTSRLRSEEGDVMVAFTDTASAIGAIILSLLFCRSGLSFLLHHPQLTATVIHALRGFDDVNKEECVPLRYASALTSKGFTCSSREVGMILEMHLRVVNAIDRLLKATPQTEEFLWVLWELCGLSRSDCGRQALLALGFFPENLCEYYKLFLDVVGFGAIHSIIKAECHYESHKRPLKAVSILIEALHSVKEMEPAVENSGASPLNLAIFHSAAEIFEVIVTDSTASSLCSWIGHAMELHKALHSSSPGSNRKDTPARLLKWIDPGVVYHKNGAIGLLRYAAVLASGGEAHLSSASILVPDLTGVENVVGEPSSVSDINVLENLGKIISERSFDGVTLNDSSIAQLTTAFRILAFISENSTVAAALYDEGAITVVYAVLVNCSFMLERSSNIYDYLVDDDHECSSISDFLLERNREQSLLDLLVPSLVLLISLLQKLQEVKEQHRNTKLMNALLRLHREVSPKLAACAADLSSFYPDSALGFGAVCHLIVSALACWPVYGWSPGLFHSLLASIQTTSVLALGPKETCSLLCLLNDLFPEEAVWLWKNGMPLLSALRTLAVRTLLGPQKERQVYWYLEPGHLERLISQLTPQLDKIAQIIQHYSISPSVVIQDMLRVFIIRIAYQNVEHASVLLRPILSWIRDRVSDVSSVLDMDAYKVYRFLDFLASLLEHPRAKMLLLEVGVVQMLMEVLERCSDATELNEKQILERNSAKCDYSLITWSLPAFKSVSLLCTSRESLQYCQSHELNEFDSLSTKDCSLIFPYLLKFCRVLPVGKELLSCLTAFRELVSCKEGQNALVSVLVHLHSCDDELESERVHERNGNSNPFNELEWKKYPPLLCCWTKLLKSIDLEDGLSTYAIEAVNLLCSGSLSFCLDGKSMDLNRVATLKCLFGLPNDMSGTITYPEDNINCIHEFITLLGSKISDTDCSATSDMNTTLCQASELAKSLLLLLEKPPGMVKVDDFVSSEGVRASPKILQMAHGSAEKADGDLYLGGLGDKLCWECPEALPDRFSRTTLPTKRKMPPVEGSNRRARGENSLADISTQNTISRGLGPSIASSGSTRRDTFRQRKPNTSRPPSMHVDDYVARERNVDGVANSNAITVPRVGSTSGRPPSIHVDEFMARQRERQNAAAAVVGEAAVQVKNAAPVNDRDTDKVIKSKLLKTDLDDDLQGIDIVFDGEESESDDKLLFPQPDDNLQHLAPVMAGQSSPHSIVEETESDVNESSQFSHMGSPLASNVDENTQSEFSSRMSVSRPEMPLTRETSVSSDKKLFEQSEDLKKFVPVKIESAASATHVYSNVPALLVELPADSRATPKTFYMKNSAQRAGNVHVAPGSRGIHDQKVLPNQPPLPPMPPPSSVSPVISQTPDFVPKHSFLFVNPGTDMQATLPAAFQVQSDYPSAFSSNPTLLSSSLSVPDSKFPRASISSPGGSIRPPPPLPSTPPPFSSNSYNLLLPRTSISQPVAYNQASAGTSELPQSFIAPVVDSQLGGLSASGTGMASYPPLPLMPSLVFSRPSSIPMTFYGSTPPQQQGENPPSILQKLSVPESSIQPIHSQSVPQMHPVHLPQLQRPLQPSQHLRPPIQTSLPLDQGVSFQSPVQVQMRSLQMLQQPQVSPLQSYYQSQQQDFSLAQQQLQVEHVHPQALHQQGGSASHQQQDSGMSLHEYFKSPEAIQSLLSDRDKLCQLLEQHPKLMQMLQERLGQL